MIERVEGEERFIRRLGESRVALLAALVVALLWPLMAALLLLDDSGFGDLSLYHAWSRAGLAGHGWPVLDFDWVYPAGALLPIAALAWIPSEAGFGLAWIGVAFALDVLVLARLDARGPHGRWAAWWWVLFVGALGSVSLARLEAVMVPLMVLAVLTLSRRPALAAAMLTFAGWIKIVPFVWLLPLVASGGRRWGWAAGASAVASAVVVVPVVLLGGGSRLLSFVTMQGDRGLQIESAWALPIQIQHVWGGGPDPRFETQLQTWELPGNLASTLVNSADMALLPVALLAYGLILRALWARQDEIVAVLAQSFFLLALLLIVVNKVGSPQYVSWPAAAVILGLTQVDAGLRREWWRPALVLLVVAALTQLIYPVFYTELIAGNRVIAAVLVVRNLLLMYLFAGAARKLWAYGSTRVTVVGA